MTAFTIKTPVTVFVNGENLVMMQDADNTVYSSRERGGQRAEKKFFFQHLIFFSSCHKILIFISQFPSFDL